MKRFVYACLMVMFSVLSYAQMSEKAVEQEIAKINQMADGHEWHDAFVSLRSLEGRTAGSPRLKYLVVKQRYNMYYRLRKTENANEAMQAMVKVAIQTKDAATIEDMLTTKAAYHAGRGESDLMRECYKSLLNVKCKGKADDEREMCYKNMIASAEKAGNKLMKTAYSDLYAAWQDSIATVRAKDELKALRTEYSAAQEDIEKKASTISWQWGIMAMLAVLLVALVSAAVFMFMVMIRKVRVARKLRKELEVTSANSVQKSVFMRNINEQIMPLLGDIMQGDVKSSVDALENMLGDVNRFIGIEQKSDEDFTIEEVNVASVCEEVVGKCSALGIEVKSETKKLMFPICRDEVMVLLENLIGELAKRKETERITLNFNKRNPHTGQFVVTAIGLKFDEEERESLFTAFARVQDLRLSSGLALPICALMAYKMGGELTIEANFAKGSRFVLEVRG